MERPQSEKGDEKKTDFRGCGVRTWRLGSGGELHGCRGFGFRRETGLKALEYARDVRGCEKMDGHAGRG